jgi:hypothetical protein
VATALTSCCLVLLITACNAQLKDCSAGELEHGWKVCDEANAWLLSDRCNIDRVPLSAITLDGFRTQYLEQRPVVLQGTDQGLFASATHKVLLLSLCHQHATRGFAYVSPRPVSQTGAMSID